MAPLAQFLLGLLVKEGAKKVAPVVIGKVIQKAVPQPSKPKAVIMNPVFLGALRHIIQVGAGAIGAEALAQGDGLNLAVAVGVSIANLAWFLVQSYLAPKV
jgi:hypothetical protein